MTKNKKRKYKVTIYLKNNTKVVVKVKDNPSNIQEVFNLLRNHWKDNSKTGWISFGQYTFNMSEIVFYKIEKRFF